MNDNSEQNKFVNPNTVELYDKLYNGVYEINGHSQPWNYESELRNLFYKKIISQSFFPKNGRILDVGCGIGGLFSNIADKDAYEFYGIDFSEVAIENIQKRLKGVFVQGDVHNLPFEENFFDNVICMETLEHVDNVQKVLSEIKRVLKPLGRLLITVPEQESDIDAKDWPGGISLHINSFSTESLKHMVIDADFAFGHCEIIDGVICLVAYKTDLDIPISNNFNKNIKNEYLRKKTSIDISNYAKAMNLAIALYNSGKIFDCFDVYEQLSDNYPQNSIEILSEAYEYYQKIESKTRYNLYVGRIFDFKINPSDKVLDIGSGHLPFPFATHLSDIALNNDNFGRAGASFKYVDEKPVYEFSVEQIPFSDKEFDFINCSHILEHVEDPVKACNEIMRVAKRGYIETPSRAKDLWLNSAKVSNHIWSVEGISNKLVFRKYSDKEVSGLESNLLMEMHCSPQTDREKAFSALIYLKPHFVNTMFYWEDSFIYEVRDENDILIYSNENGQNLTSGTTSIEIDYFISVTNKMISAKKLAEAEILLKYLSEKHPDNGDVFNQLGCLYNVKGDYINSLVFFQKANRLQPNELNITKNLIETSILAKDYTLASKYISLLDKNLIDDEIECFKRNIEDNNSRHKLKFLQINTFYEIFLEDFYKTNSDLLNTSFTNQVEGLLNSGFSEIHHLSPYMKKMGYDSIFIVPNDKHSQLQWLKENDLEISINTDLCKEILKNQIETIKPNILYVSDPMKYDSSFLKTLSWKPDLTIGWCASDIFPNTDWSLYDIILSGISGIREAALKIGAKAVEAFFPGFPITSAEYVKDIEPAFDVSFCGSWTIDQHEKRNRYLGLLSKQAEIGTFSLALYLNKGQNLVPKEVAKFDFGTKFGKSMYKAIKTGKISVDIRGDLRLLGNKNLIIDIAKNETMNMRIFEVTGCGIFLLAEYFDNLSSYFEIGKEIEVFRDDKELVEKIKYYIAHPKEREEIARKGQERCLKYYSIEKRCQEFDFIIKKYLKLKQVVKKSESPKSTTELSITRNTLHLLKGFSIKEHSCNDHCVYKINYENNIVYTNNIISAYTEIKDILIGEIYKINSNKTDPFIIDGGGHIGLFTIYAKMKYPQAKILAFEPDDSSFKLINLNVSANNLSGVKVVKSGLYNQDTILEFGSDNSDGSSLYLKENTSKIKVEKLSKYIDKEVDYLKLNIEGAELEVLEDIGSKLSMVKEICIEYHGFKEIGQRLHRILEILDEYGFRYLIHDFDAEVNPATKPPFNIDTNTRFFLLIYGKRILTPKQLTNDGGNLNKFEPLSRKFGFDRGTPIDRIFMNRFLEKNSDIITGIVLEIAESTYTKKYGKNVTKIDVLHAAEGNKEATIVGDLATGKNILKDRFDCIILLQTLHVIYDYKAVIKNCYEALKEGGVLLLTAPGISQISRYDMDRWGDYWRFTDLSLKKVLAEYFRFENIEVEHYGNYKLVSEFLNGRAAEELDAKDFDFIDDDYQLFLGAKATKKCNKYSDKEPLILLYHRVAEDPINSQLLAVSSKNFEDHLKYLKANFRVVPLETITDELSNKMLKPNSIALTFDDGYLDNLTNALPLLEKYQIPATIFITTDFIGKNEEFWWDELERIFLYEKNIPPFLSITDDVKGILEWDLSSLDGRIKAWEDLQSFLRNQPYHEIRSFLDDLVNGWMQNGCNVRASHKTMNLEQLKKLAASPFIEIGSHTITHSLLSTLSFDDQFKEISESKRALEMIVGKKVNLISYPFGSKADFNKDSQSICKQCGYSAAIANIQGDVKTNSDLYALPRRLVRDWSGTEFADWMSSSDKNSLEAKTVQSRQDVFRKYWKN